MSFSMSFNETVDKEIQEEFGNYALAQMGSAFEMRVGDSVMLESVTTGNKRIFAIRHRMFRVIPDDEGRGSVELVLGELSEREMSP